MVATFAVFTQSDDRITLPEAWHGAHASIYEFLFVCPLASVFRTNMAEVFRIIKLYLLFVLGLLTKLYISQYTLRATTNSKNYKNLCVGTPPEA